MAKPSNIAPWDDDAIQFPRLIDELSAAGAFHVPGIMDALCESMDLEPKQIRALVARATKRFEAVKRELRQQ